LAKPFPVKNVIFDLNFRVMTKDNYLFGDQDNLDFFMQIHTCLQENIENLKIALDYEEVKGLFPTFSRNSLYKAYQEKLALLMELEAKMLKFCPSLDDLFGSNG
jgi:hypothetical protein